MNALAKVEKINNSPEMAVIEQVVLQGDLSKLTPEQRVTYYHEVCKSVGLNPFTRPFEYILLQGKLTLYTRKDGTEQLRRINGVSVTEIQSKVVDDLYIVTATATTKEGRCDTSTGVVTIGNLKGDAKANATMKAETKAKRRVTLSICGLGWLDESEIDSIPSAKRVSVNMETGEMENSDVKQLDIDPIPQPSLSTEQAIELSNILNSCDPEFKKKYLNEYIPQKYKVDLLDEVPASRYQSIKKLLTERADEYQKKLVELEMADVIKADDKA